MASRRRIEIIALLIVVIGFVVRLLEAWRTYLNPDEALIFYLSLPDSLMGVYSASAPFFHPPLLFFILHFVIRISSSEIALRLIPILAGSAFCWIVYRWVAKVWNTGAGIAALLILTFSPNLYLLSAQARGYTIMLFFAALAMLLLETALETGSIIRLVLFSGCLYLAILSEYSAAWFAAAAAVYFLIRARQSRVTWRFLTVWAVGQAGALVIYAVLFKTAMAPLLIDPHGKRIVSTYLDGAFPAPHQNALVFAVLGTTKQFAYTFSSVPLGIVALVLFAVGLITLWKNHRALAISFVVPFLLAWLGALVRIHPYGRSRHTVILSFFIAAGAGIAIERILRSRARIAVLAAIVLVASWPFIAERDIHNIEPRRFRKHSLMTAVNYLRSSIPADALVMTDHETGLLLRYYLLGGKAGYAGYARGPFARPLGPFNAAWFRWDLGDVDTFLTDVAALRSNLHLDPNQPLWVADSGFDIDIARQLRVKYPEFPLLDYHDFDGALIVFRLPAAAAVRSQLPRPN